MCGGKAEEIGPYRLEDGFCGRCAEGEHGRDYRTISLILLAGYVAIVAIGILLAKIYG